MNYDRCTFMPHPLRAIIATLLLSAGIDLTRVRNANPIEPRKLLVPIASDERKSDDILLS